MTAFAIFGSATSTSLASRGKSTIVDLPMTSARKRTLVWALTEIGAVARSSLAAAGAKAAASVSTATAENDKAWIRNVRNNRFALHFISSVLLVTSVLRSGLRRRRER